MVAPPDKRSADNAPPQDDVLWARSLHYSHSGSARPHRGLDRRPRGRDPRRHRPPAAAARPPCCAACPGSCGPNRARSGSTASPCTPWGPGPASGCDATCSAGSAPNRSCCPSSGSGRNARPAAADRGRDPPQRQTGRLRMAGPPRHRRLRPQAPPAPSTAAESQRVALGPRPRERARRDLRRRATAPLQPRRVRPVAPYAHHRGPLARDHRAAGHPRRGDRDRRRPAVRPARRTPGRSRGPAPTRPSSPSPRRTRPRARSPPSPRLPAARPAPSAAGRRGPSAGSGFLLLYVLADAAARPA